MAGLLNVIAAVFGGISLVPGLESIFKPQTPPDQTTIVQITLGTGNLSASLGGNVPGVSLWDVEGQSIGGVFGSSSIEPQGNTISIPVVANTTVGNVAAEYIAVTNGGDDAVCVAAVGVTFPTGQQTAFMTNIGVTCGADWYPSLPVIPDSNLQSSCIWIDRDGSNGLRFQGFGVHLTDFVNSYALSQEYLNNTASMCKSGPRFRMYEQLKTEDSILVFNPPLQYNEDGSDADISKVINNPGVPGDLNMALQNAVCSREAFGAGCPGAARPKAKRDSQFMQGQLVISAYAQHSAREVCESDTSHGPDFASVNEGLYCDMDQKKLWNICSQNVTQMCFDTEQFQMRGSNFRVQGVSWNNTDSSVPSKSYQTTHKWGFV
jgi:hypothetical protein